MNDFNSASARGYAGTLDVSRDAGLRAFMLGVYNKLGLGLVVSGALAYVTSSVPAVRDMLFSVTAQGVGYTPLGMAVNFAPLVLLFGSMFMMRNPSAKGASLLYWGVVVTIGASLGVLGLVYTGQSLTQAFMITAAAFFGLSLFGYTTKRNLSGMGSFLVMGLIGVIVAMVVNMFLQSALMMFVISAVGVLVFAGFIAYDTHRLKAMYYQTAGDGQAMSVATSYGALSLYINVVNLFRFILMFVGIGRD